MITAARAELMRKYCCLTRCCRRATSSSTSTIGNSSTNHYYSAGPAQKKQHQQPLRTTRPFSRPTEQERFYSASSALSSDTTCTNTTNRNLPHDVGGELTSYGSILPHEDHNTEPLQCWEQQCHSTFAVLAMNQILGTDELRRAVEALTPEQYNTWSYYEKWTAGMTTLLLEKGIISQEELQHALFGDSNNVDDTSLFQVGDAVRVRTFHPTRKVEWRRPHLRTPGYVYGVSGTIERVCGKHGDPSFLAFGVTAPPQVQLYRVRFQTSDLWPEQYPNQNDDQYGDESTKDVVEVEIYQHWLEPKSVDDNGTAVLEPLLFDHTDDGSDCMEYHSHHDDKDNHDHHDNHHHHHDDTDDHVHEPRKIVEERAAAAEGLPRPGKELYQAMRSILLEKNIISADDIRLMMERLDTAGQRLDGATLVVQAWQDAAFSHRLLQDAAAAASELGISTSNPNAPTVLTVVPNTPTTHNLIVCTLCSCYPSGLLGIAPTWYKSREYRARAVREPRVVLSQEFGVSISPLKQLRVHDSTADHRYLVLPERPAGTDGWSEEELRALVTRDTMLGVSLPQV